jgi:hypothetical protein
MATELESAAARAGGAALAALTRGLAAVRPVAKPLHPRGELLPARLVRRPTSESCGVDWLEGDAEEEVTVRLSRAIGLPAPLPDIHGLALRAQLAGGGHGDVLFASTGLGRLTRFTLTAARHPAGRPMTTLLPYRTPTGPMLLSATPTATPTSPRGFALGWAHPAGDWTTWADLELLEDRAGDPLVSFDPVLNQVPGLEQYAWVRRLREPAYGVARRSRQS